MNLESCVAVWKRCVSGRSSVSNILEQSAHHPVTCKMDICERFFFPNQGISSLELVELSFSFKNTLKDALPWPSPLRWQSAAGCARPHSQANISAQPPPPSALELSGPISLGLFHLFTHLPLEPRLPGFPLTPRTSSWGSRAGTVQPQESSASSKSPLTPSIFLPQGPPSPVVSQIEAPSSCTTFRPVDPKQVSW